MNLARSALRDEGVARSNDLYERLKRSRVTDAKAASCAGVSQGAEAGKAVNCSASFAWAAADTPVFMRTSFRSL